MSYNRLIMIEDIKELAPELSIIGFDEISEQDLYEIWSKVMLKLVVN